MSVRKTYMLKYLQTMQMHALMGAKLVLVEFTSPSSYNKNLRGTFSTSNPDVIAAIEKHGDFNRDFYVFKEEVTDEPAEKPVYRANPLEVKKLREQKEKEARMNEDEVISSRKKEPDVTVEEKPVETVVSQAEHTDLPDLPPEWDGKVVVSEAEVSNVQQAKEYLKKSFPELTARQMLNKANVVKIAEEKGIKFTAIVE